MSDAAHSLAYRNPERLVKVPNPAHCPLPTAANFGDSTQIPQELLYAGGSGGKSLLIGGSLLRTSACRVLTALGRIEVWLTAMAEADFGTQSTQVYELVFEFERGGTRIRVPVEYL